MMRDFVAWRCGITNDTSPGSTIYCTGTRPLASGQAFLLIANLDNLSNDDQPDETMKPIKAFVVGSMVASDPKKSRLTSPGRANRIVALPVLVVSHVERPSVCRC